MVEANGDNPKKPEEMSSEEILKQIETGGTTPEVKEPDVKEEKKETLPVEEPKENLILGKFKTTDDALKAYQELEKKLGEQGNEVGSLKKQEELRKQQLSQFFDLDPEGNIIGVKQAPTTRTVTEEDQLARVRPYFPDWDDQRILAHLGIMGTMVQQGIKQFKESYDKELEPLKEIKFERDVERQIKDVRTKYKSLWDDNEEIVRQRLETLPPDIRARKGAAETILLTTLGEKTPELKSKLEELERIRQTEGKKPEAFVESSGKNSVPTPPVDLGKMKAADMEKYINSLKKKE